MSKSLEVQLRNSSRRSDLSALRNNGRIPAIVYGEGMKQMEIHLSTRLFKRWLSNQSSTVQLVLEGENSEAMEVKLQELHRDPVSGHVLHVDFMKVAA